MLAVSVVTHKTRPEELNTLLGCLRREAAVDCIYVIDNSPDSSLETVAAGDRTIYRHVENRGYGASHNVAIRDSMLKGADYHLVVNPDVFWDGEILTELTDYMDAHTDVGQLMPLTFYPDGRLQYTCRLVPAPFDLILRRFLPAGWYRERRSRFLLEHFSHDRILNAPYLLGSFMLFRVKALESEGLFDERFFMYPEDIDISRRLHRHWLTLFYPGVKIVHAHAAASGKFGKMLRIHIINMIKYFNKWGWIFDSERREFNRRVLEDIAASSPQK